MLLFFFLGEGPGGKKDVSLRTSGLSSPSTTVPNRKQGSVFRKESLQLGRIQGVYVQCITALWLFATPDSLVNTHPHS